MFFNELIEIFERPEVFSKTSVKELWTDEYLSRQMLKYHLDGSVDRSSRSFEFIDRSVDWMISHFNIGKGSKIADFGCGPGLYTSRLARTGARVTGIDFSENSIEYAKEHASENGMDIEYIVQDYLKFNTDRKFDLIIMIMCDFCVLGPEDRRTILNKFRSLLNDGGSVLLDVYSMKGFEERKEMNLIEKNSMDNFWSADDYFGLYNVMKYEGEKVVLDKHTIVEKDRKRTFYNWLQYYSKESLTELFEECGLRIIEFYSNVAGDPYGESNTEFAVVAEKM
jgi:cyclopropane fatty-acyl-phospholipid synthase-like methyltransferase